MERVTAISANRAFSAFAVTLLAALLILLVFRPGDESAAAVDLGDPNAWIEHGLDGELLQINALTGEVTTRIEVAQDGDDFVALPHGDGAVVLDTSSNQVSLVSGSQLSVGEPIDVPLTEGATDRDVRVFGQDERDGDIVVIDEDQLIVVDPGSGLVTPTLLPSPIQTPVQDVNGTIFGLDPEGSALVRIGADGVNPVATVTESLAAETDQRSIVRSGGRIFALDPARLSMSEVLPEGGLGNPVCMRSIANGAIHGGAGPEDEAIVLSLNAAASTLAISTADGVCSELDVEVTNGEYGSPVAVGGVAYLPFWEQGRIISIDLETGDIIGDLPFGTSGDPFELEVFGSMVWANERLGPFAAVVEADEITAIAKISAVTAVAGDSGEDGDGSSITDGGDQEDTLRSIGDSGDVVFAAESDELDSSGTGTGSADDGEAIAETDEPNSIPRPEAFGIELEDAALPPEPEEDESPEEPTVDDELDSDDEVEPPDLGQALVANFVVSTVEATVGETIRFTDTSLGLPIGWLWTFGDGTTETTPNAEKVWDEAGDYEITLTVTNANGVSSSQATTVRIVPETEVIAPNADFQFSSRTIEEGGSVSFESTTTGDADILEWDFGNGRTGVGEEVTHTFEQAGQFLVVLIASNEAGSTTSAVEINVVAGIEPPIAAIAPSPRMVEVGQRVTFESVSLNDPTQTRWSFDDGEEATGVSVRHAWSEPGEYRVVLRVENSEGMDRTFTDIVVEERVVEPISVFTQSATDVLVGETVRFSNESLNNPDELRWEFDDGTNSSRANPSHSWDRAGTYRVTLRAENEAGSNRSGVTITVSDPVDPPVASFSVSSNVIATGTDVRFTDSSGSNPEQWRWEFEGAGSAEERNPFRRWDRAGTYTVRLTVTNEGGSSSSQTEITVIDPPTAWFGFEMVDANTVRFFDQSQNATQWLWNFGDGATSNEQNPTHFFSGGSFDVSLTTANEVATAGPATQRVTISQPPVAVASCTFDGGQLYCTSDGSERASSFQWSAEGSVTNFTPNGATTSFSFDRGGRPTVTLVVTNDQGESDTVSILAPRVSAGLEPRVLDVRVASVDGDLVQLVSDFDRDPTNWVWNIAGVELVAGANTSSPTFRVPGNGTYSGDVIASNLFGDDRDPVRFTIDTIDPEEPEIEASFTWSVIEPGVVAFVNTSTGPDDAIVVFRFTGEIEIIDGDRNRPIVRYPDEGGTFPVLLVVRDDDDRDVARADVFVPPA